MISIMSYGVLIKTLRVWQRRRLLGVVVAVGTTG